MLPSTQLYCEIGLILDCCQVLYISMWVKAIYPPRPGMLFWWRGNPPPERIFKRISDREENHGKNAIGLVLNSNLAGFVFQTWQPLLCTNLSIVLTTTMKLLQSVHFFIYFRITTKYLWNKILQVVPHAVYTHSQFSGVKSGTLVPIYTPSGVDLTLGNLLCSMYYMYVSCKS